MIEDDEEEIEVPGYTVNWYGVAKMLCELAMIVAGTILANEAVLWGWQWLRS